MKAIPKEKGHRMIETQGKGSIDDERNHTGIAVGLFALSVDCNVFGRTNEFENWRNTNVKANFWEHFNTSLKTMVDCQANFWDHQLRNREWRTRGTRIHLEQVANDESDWFDRGNWRLDARRACNWRPDATSVWEAPPTVRCMLDRPRG